MLTETDETVQQVQKTFPGIPNQLFAYTNKQLNTPVEQSPFLKILDFS
jgi:hypothetical protein